ncbi:hypothetical protein CFOL_v3_17211 [Cephalotus follicularis]|uniref:ditrans,polycis-polyprenyl diphosphate synthase [(2E,6E)-farnesyldiphosphate specific] n=1 Tax=Cephalotus follicularis TaxID=3775 RepID=A0A1Q3C0U3_CEPFO|nr:hypothetical protein CFOL_v3_17211 [Cephalotus follicularis]
MDLNAETRKLYSWIAQVLVQIGNLVLRLLWHLVHFAISIWYFALGIANKIESYLISSGLLKSYKALNAGKLKYLAIVVESEEAYQISKVIELLQWLTTIGVKNACLYDAEGVLKKSKEVILGKLSNATLFEEADKNDSLLDEKHITLEFASLSDGKEAVAKAANLLLAKYSKFTSFGGDQEEQTFTEAHLTEALGTIGCQGPEIDLLLVYGPERCHLGFPAWRLRYTEILHMGPLNSMSYGFLIKAIHKFTTVRQNYGK